MSRSLIWAVGLVYLCVAIDQFRKREIGMGIAWVGYCIGNIGLGMHSR